MQRGSLAPLLTQTAENTLAGAANALQAVTLKTLVKALATPAMLENTKMEMVAHPAVLEDSQLERAAAAAHHVHMEDINHMEVVFHASNATLEAFRTTLQASHATLATVESSCPTKGEHNASNAVQGLSPLKLPPARVPTV